MPSTREPVIITERDVALGVKFGSLLVPLLARTKEPAHYRAWLVAFTIAFVGILDGLRDERSSVETATALFQSLIPSDPHRSDQAERVH